MDIETYKIAKAYKQMQSAPETLRCGLGHIKVCESSLTRILGKRPQGFCVVSACRKKTKELVEDLRRLRLGNVPVCGGFREGGNVDVFERSFLLTGNTRDGKVLPFEEVKKIAIDLGKKYFQDSVLISPPDEPPYYYVATRHVERDDSGNETVHEVGEEQRWFDGGVKLNDLMQEYFTSLNKVSEHPANGKDATVKRFSYTSESAGNGDVMEVWFNSGFNSYTEGHVRWLKGEMTCRDELLDDFRVKR